MTAPSRGRRVFLRAAMLALGSMATVPALAAANTLTVDNDRIQCPVADYTTIQAAVAVASNGDTIKICAGTYDVPGGPAPSSGLKIEKNLTLAGAGADKVFIQPAQGTGSIAQATPNPRDEYGNVITVRRRLRELVEVNLSGFTVRAGDVTVEAGIAMTDVNVGTIKGVKVEGITPATGPGSGAFEPPATLASHGQGIIVANTIEQTNNITTISGSDVSGFNQTGIHIDNRLLNGAGSVGNGSRVTAEITDTKITGYGSGSPIAQDGIEAFGSGARLRLTKSAISGVGLADGSAAAVLLHGVDVAGSSIGASAANANSLTANAFGVYNAGLTSGLASSAVDATHNFWGTTVDGSSLPLVSAQVLYDPVEASAPTAPTLDPATDAPPSIEWDNPENGAILSPGTGLSLDSVARDDFGVTTVAYTLDGNPVGTAATPPLDGSRVYSYSWTPTAADAGVNRTLTATATDEAGQTTSSSISVTIPLPPAFGGTVAIGGYSGGYAAVGQELTCDNSGVVGSPPPTVTYEWFVNATAAGTDSPTYTPIAVDAGKTITCKVTLANASGTVSQTSAGVPVAVNPAFTSPVAVTGAVYDPYARVGEVLGCTANGSGTPAPAVAREWRLDGTPIAGATGATYTPVAGDVSHALTCQVTLTNPGASVVGYDTVTVGAAPSFATPPATLSGTTGGFAVPAQQLSCSDAGASGYPAPQLHYQWLLNGVQMGGQTQSTYTPTVSDQGKTIACRTIATNFIGEATSTSTGVTVATPPAIASVDITGYTGDFALEDDALVCAATGVSGSPAPTVTYEWQSDGTPIDGATTAGYTVLAADVSHVLTCKATAASVAASTSGTDTVTVGAPPAFAATPAITGTTAGYAISGEELTCSDGSPSGFPVPTVSYAWAADSSPVGTDSPAYTASVGDQGAAITCTVTIENALGDDDATSDPVTVATPSAIASVDISGYSGDYALEGDSLVCAATGVTGDPTPTVGYIWLSDGTPIGGATTDSYTVLAADVGHVLTCKATATSATDSIQATDTVTVGALPSLAATPAITGTTAGYAISGQELSCSDGSPSGFPVPTVSYAWKADGSAVGTDSPTYTPTVGDQGAAITCTVTIENVLGDDTATSDPVTVVAPPAIASVDITGFSGDFALVGDALACAASGVTGSPAPTVSYEWLSDGTPIGGATTANYTVLAGDVGHLLSCKATAASAAASTSATDTVTVGAVPALAATPAITGATAGYAISGQELSCSDGSPSGFPVPTVSYAWAADSSPVGTDSPTYTPSVGDQGAAITCTVTIENALGDDDATSDPVTVATPPDFPGLVLITGASGSLASPGDTLSCTFFGSGDPTPTVGFQWLRDGTPIAGETGFEYEVVEADKGHTLACGVTLTNIAGSAFDADNENVGGEPDGPDPTVAGTPKVSFTVSCDRGTWTGIPTPSFSYQWYSNGSPISGATGQTYAPAPSQAGIALSCAVTATNSLGTSTRTSAPVTIKPGPPSVLGAFASSAPLIAKKGLLTLARVSCDVGPCELSAPSSVTVMIRKKSYVILVFAPKTLAGGESAAVQIQLPKKALKAFKKGRKAVFSGPASVEVTANGGGGAASETLAFRLKRPKPKN